MIILLAMSISSGIAQDNTTASGDATFGVAAGEPAAVPSESAAAAEELSIQGIWALSLGDIDITLAVNQSGDSIFGQAKFEGDDPWNGVIAGSLSGRAVHIALAAMQGNVLVSTELSGTALDDSIEGSYVRSNSDGAAAKGEFAAARISPDTTGYLPAEVKAPPAAALANAADQSDQQAYQQSEQQPQAEEQTAVQQPAVQARRSAFKDVRDLAKGIDPNIMPRSAPL